MVIIPAFVLLSIAGTPTYLGDYGNKEACESAIVQLVTVKSRARSLIRDTSSYTPLEREKILTEGGLYYMCVPNVIQKEKK